MCLPYSGRRSASSAARSGLSITKHFTPQKSRCVPPWLESSPPKLVKQQRTHLQHLQSNDGYRQTTTECQFPRALPTIPPLINISLQGLQALDATSPEIQAHSPPFLTIRTPGWQLGSPVAKGLHIMYLRFRYLGVIDRAQIAVFIGCRGWRGQRRCTRGSS